MGYSVMTPFASIEKRNIMFDFLSKNMTNINKLLGVQGEDDFVSGPYINEDVDYCPGYNYGPENSIPVIGFNYHDHSLGMDYAYRICYWMAAIAGIAEYVKQVDGELKFIIYDGCESWYLVPKGVKLKDKGFVETDEIGFRSLGRRLYSFIFNEKQLREFDQKIETELQRLTKIWNI